MTEIRSLRESAIDQSQPISTSTNRPKVVNQRTYKKKSTVIPTQIDEHRKGGIQQKLSTKINNATGLWLKK